jgi:hypothetical protein
MGSHATSRLSNPGVIAVHTPHCAPARRKSQGQGVYLTDPSGHVVLLIVAPTSVAPVVMAPVRFASERSA